MKLLPILFLTLMSVATFAGHPLNAINQVENQKVCMVNNTYFAKNQIPVQVDNKTYYGCCENCKKTLKDKKTSRVAVDPVTKKTVDKANAIIGADKEGNVYYFENLANLEKYSKASSK